jgi:hypothetical protein
MYTFAALALLCAIPDEPAKAPLKADTVPADLTGIYAVTGTDEQGQVYGGSVLIHKAGAGYVVLWSTVLRTDEGLAVSTVQGTGLLKGDVLAVSWGDGKRHGVTIYTVSEKRLAGEWTQSAALGHRNRETLTRVANVPASGDVQ